MSDITRKQFMKGIVAGGLASLWSPASSARNARTRAAPSGSLQIPYPPKPWAQAIRLVGSRPPLDPEKLRSSAPSYDRLPLYADFCLWADSAERWHCIGLLFEGNSAESFRWDRLFHYQADSLQGPYRSLGYVDLGYGSKSAVWAPFIVRDKDRLLMFYTLEDQNKNTSLRVAEAADSLMQSWRRLPSDSEIVAIEPAIRDPMVLHDPQSGRYFLYYVSTEIDKSGYGNGLGCWRNVVRVRTSTDLRSWSDPHTVLATPPGYVSAESIFVMAKHGYYYMWVSGFDYAQTSLYISTDPWNFGDAERNRIEEQPGHGPEIVSANGHEWMACEAIASVPGLPNGKELGIAQHDLEGVWLQPLHWRPASAEERLKVVEK